MCERKPHNAYSNVAIVVKQGSEVIGYCIWCECVCVCLSKEFLPTVMTVKLRQVLQKEDHGTNCGGGFSLPLECALIRDNAR